jgi:hypothetical protein
MNQFTLVDLPEKASGWGFWQEDGRTSEESREVDEEFPNRRNAPSLMKSG